MQESVLGILMNTDEYISGQMISERLGVSRQAVWKSINSLREKGYEIDSVQNKGYKLRSIPDNLDENTLRALVNAKVIGKSIVVLDRVTSTNDYLKRMGDEGAENGTVVTTREQYSGKGRLGRAWESRRDENIAFSLLLRPKMKPAEVASITPLAGLAVCKALRRVTGLDCKIKWPNDIVVGSRKLVGILTEMSAELYAISYVVIGIGINVDQVAFPQEIAHKATSIFNETQKYFNKNELLAQIIDSLEEEFMNNNLELTPKALEEYSSLCISLGRAVTFSRGGRELGGTATSVSKNGELVITAVDGKLYEVNSGEVTVQGIY